MHTSVFIWEMGNDMSNEIDMLSYKDGYKKKEVYTWWGEKLYHFLYLFDKLFFYILIS